MEKKNEVEVVQKSEVVNNPQETIALAISKGSNLEQIEKLMLLQERFDANQAKKAYVRAMAEFKINAPLVDKDKTNNQYKSKYTSLGNLINTVSPVLSKFGLSASWDIKQNGIIEVTCKMTHELGHSETATMNAPADTSGAKNVIQQIKSTITYLKAVTFESICGLASTDANLDDDGAIVGAELITDAEKNTLLDLITSTKSDMQKFLKFMGVTELANIHKNSLNKAIVALSAKMSGPKAKA
jgi:hypothetical protein